VAGLPVVVPFWVAISLKIQQKCHVHIPDWLDAGMCRSIDYIYVTDPATDKLLGLVDNEKVPGSGFGNLPFNYLEIADQLLKQYVMLSLYCCCL
jgi:hypothetical protein